MQKLHLLLSSLLILAFNYVSAQDFTQVKYGPEARQFVDIYIAPSDVPTPVYFDAHGNGGTTNMPNSIIEALKAEGISTVAWESLTSVNSPAEVETGWADAELMFAWIKANAATYNFDTTQFIIGGSSRGSILSWKYGHRPNPNIRGLYMYNALPEGAWGFPQWWLPTEDVNTSSPPIFFVYKREPGSSEDPVNPDIHDPENGMIIMDKYDELGIGDRDTLIHSIGESGNSDRYQFLVAFALSVLEKQVITSTPTAEISPALRVFPNPFRNQVGILGLSGNEYFMIRDLHGRILSEGKDPIQFNWARLDKGVYFLSIQKDSKQKIFKLIKN